MGKLEKILKKKFLKILPIKYETFIYIVGLLLDVYRKV